MNSLRILFNRLVQDFRFQYKVVKMVFDWTVMLYIAIPGLVISGFIYRSWWIELPLWSNYVNLPVIAVFVFNISSVSRFRSFVKEADGVFLLKYKLKYINLKKYSFFYSLMKNTISVFLAVVLALPFLHNKHSFNFSEIVCFLLLFIGFSFFIMAIKMTLTSYFHGWKEKLFISVINVVFLFSTILLYSNYVYIPVYFIGIALLFIIIAIILAFQRINTTRYFQQEVVKENEERMRYINLIFGVAPELEKPKMIKRNRPLLFPQSQRIFKKNLAQNGFYELFIKIFLRNSIYFSGYFKLLGVTAIAMTALPPLYLKLIILLGFSVFIWIWVSHLWDKVIQTNPIGRQYVNHNAYFTARKKAILFLTIPAIGILSTILIVNLIWLS